MKHPSKAELRQAERDRMLYLLELGIRTASGLKNNGVPDPYQTADALRRDGYNIILRSN